MLAAQDPVASMRMLLKMAGGGDMKEMDVNAFLAQAKEYEETGGALDRVFKILNTLGASPPFNTLRAAELDRWIGGGTYQRVVQGDYPKRGPAAEGRPLDQDMAQAPDYYTKEAEAAVKGLRGTAKPAAPGVPA